MTPDGTLVVTVGTCNGEPALDEVDVRQDQVRVAITSEKQDPENTNDCQDQVEVPLDQRLGTRTIFDLTSERTVQVHSQ